MSRQRKVSGLLSKSRRAVALANELEGTRRVQGILQVTLVGWLQSRLKMRDESPSPIIYIPDCEVQVQIVIKGKRVIVRVRVQE